VLETEGPAVEETIDQGSGTILLAEDEAFIRKLTSRILETNGYDVLVAADGTEALAIGKRNIGRIDLLLTDVIMPGLGGAELAVELRRSRPDLPILYMSGYAFEALDLEELGDGECYLPKPFTSDVLLKEIGRMLVASG
jgi:CheY-like chemotaxis protein